MCGDWSANNPDNTNLLWLANALLGPYCAKQTGIYKCPADQYLCVEGGLKMPRVRSLSMNGFIEGDAYKGQKATRRAPSGTRRIALTRNCRILSSRCLRI